MELSALQPTFGEYLQYFKDIDFETFLIMKPEHIKEAIPSLGQRIKFENLYSKFLSGLDEVIIVSNANETITASLDAMDTEAAVDIDLLLASPQENEVISPNISKERTYLRIITECFLTCTALICSVMIWYLMICCSLKYEVLARELKYMGRIVDQNQPKVSQVEVHRIFLQDLKMAIDAYKHIRGSIDDFQSFSASMLVRMIFVYTFCFNICELFMITYFGNEIKLSSHRLSYSLFESQWIEQPQVTKKCVIIFGEYLKQPHELLIGKLYPLTLETFTRILNSAYSMFNILKNTSAE